MCARRRDETCHHRLAVQEHGARAALALGATLLRADQHPLFAQQTQERFLVPTLKDIFLAVDGCLDRRIGKFIIHNSEF